MRFELNSISKFNLKKFIIQIHIYNSKKFYQIIVKQLRSEINIRNKIYKVTSGTTMDSATHNHGT